MMNKSLFSRIIMYFVTTAMIFNALQFAAFATEKSQDLAITNMDYKIENKISVIVSLSVDMQRKNGHVLVALYDKNNTLISCKKGTASQLYTFDKSNNYCGSYTAKAFYFESLTSIKPLCNTASMTLEGKHISVSEKCLSTDICSVCGESFTNWHYFAPDEWVRNQDLNAHGKLCECANEHTAVEYHAYCTPVTIGEQTIYQCVCGAQSETQSHNFNAWTASDKGHYRICLSCGVKEEEIGHTDVVNHVCQKCGYELIHTGTIGGDDHSSVVIDPGGGGVVIIPSQYHECGVHKNIIGLNDGLDHSMCLCGKYKCSDADHSNCVLAECGMGHLESDGRNHTACAACGGHMCDTGAHFACKVCNEYFCSSADHSECASKGLEYTLKEDGAYEVTGIGTCTVTDLIIPSTYNGKAVTSIGGYAFYSNHSITSAVLPDSITSIGELGFAHCSRLTDIVMPKNMTSIDKKAFFKCQALKSIVIPDGVTTIHQGTFSVCKALNDISMPKSVTKLEMAVIDQDHVIIHYAGTKSEWEAIDKSDLSDGGYWNARTSGDKRVPCCIPIFCSDGIYFNGHAKCSKCGGNLCDGTDHEHEK